MVLAQSKIGLIVCSTRTPRVGPDVSSWVASTINSTASPNATLTVLDLANFPLPISPTGHPIPAEILLPLSAAPYQDPAVNAWSQEVRQYAGFIFVSPQYNWSFPAAVKCAIDHLYHEWAGKPALIVTYGKRGGGKANVQLRQVLLGVRMSPWDGAVELPIAVGEGPRQSSKGSLAREVVEDWEEGGKKKELLERWEELVGAVAQTGPS